MEKLLFLTESDTWTRLLVTTWPIPYTCAEPYHPGNGMQSCFALIRAHRVMGFWQGIAVGPLYGAEGKTKDLSTNQAHIFSRAGSASGRFFLFSAATTGTGNVKRRTLRKSSKTTVYGCHCRGDMAVRMR